MVDVLPQNLQAEQPQYYLNMSRPVGNIVPDKSKGMALAGAGKMMDQAFSAYDPIKKSSLDSEIHNTLDPMQEDELDRLKKDWSMVIGGAKLVPPGVMPQNQPPNILDRDPTGGTGQAPTEVKEVGNRLSTIEGVRAKGQLSMTHLDMMSDSFLKDLRARNPGYKNYIDAEGERVTGRTVAMKTINSLMRDINSYADKVGKARDDALNMIDRPESMKVLGSDWAQAHNEVKNQVPGASDRWLGMVAKAQAQEYKHDWQMKDLQMRAEKGKVDGDEMERVQTQYANDLATRFADLGVHGGHTDKEIADLHSDPNKRTPSDVEARQELQILNQKREEMRADLIRHNNQDTGKGSPAGIMGAERLARVLKTFDEATMPIIKAYSDGEYGKATAVAKINEATISDMSLQMDKRWPVMVGVKALAKYGSPMTSYVNDLITSAANDVDPVTGKMRIPTPDAVSLAGMAARVMTGIPDGTGQRTTLNDAADVIDNKPNRTPETKAAMMDKLISSMERLGKKDVPRELRQEAFKNIYGPDNRGFLSKIEMDHLDPSTQQRVNGAVSVFARLTSPEMLKAAHDLGQYQWDDTKNWVLGEARSSLYHDPMLELSRGDPGVRISYDSKSNQFQGIFQPTFPGARRKDLEMQLDLVNKITKAVAGVGRYESLDVNGYILSVLQDNGFDIGPDTKNQLARAVMSAVKPTTEQGIESTP
jgi:hypothetical protein